MRPLHLKAAVVGLVAVGTVVRLFVAFDSYGVQFDQESLALVRGALTGGDLGVYDLPPNRWPYPSGFFPLILLAGEAADLTGTAFHGWVQVPAVLADAALAFLVAYWLDSEGRGAGTVLAGAALVAIGPSFAFISGYHGQIDSVAILPAAAGVLVWTRGDERRYLAAGLLIGAGAAIKTTPAFCLLALIPTARSWRESLSLVAVAAAVPLVAVAPWLLSNFDGTSTALTSNKGVGGFGGLSAFIQPDLTRYWSTLDAMPPLSDTLLSIGERQNLIVAAAVLAVGALLAVRRTPAVTAACVIWLTVLVFNVNFAFQYLVWALPFFLLAGRVREVALLQAVLLPPTVLLYVRPDGIDGDGWLYFATVQFAWLCILGGWLAALTTLRDRRPSAETA